MQVLTDGHVADAYGVEVVRGQNDGVPFLLPWAQSAEPHAGGSVSAISQSK